MMGKLGLRPWLTWGLGALLFFVVYCPRVAPSVMQPELMAAFRINAYGFGTLTAFFLYAYVPLQIPVGMLIDKFGARRLLYIMALVAGCGTLLFASSQSFAMAKLSRFVLGFGGAFGFVGALKLAKEWFPGHMLGLLSGLTQSLGMLGAAIGEAPTAYAVHHYGWRPTMSFLGGLLIVIALLIFLFVKNKTSTEERKEAHVGLMAGLMMVLKNPQSWLVGCYLGFSYAPIMVFSEAWGVSFLQASLHITVHQAAAAIGLIFIGFGVGGPTMGFVSDRLRKRKPMMLLSPLLSLLVILVVLYDSHLSLSLLYVCTFCLGLFSAGLGVAYALSGEINPHRVAGTSIAFANMSSIAIGMILEPIVGLILDLRGGTLVDGAYTYSATDYRVALLMLPAGFVISFFLGMIVKESNCRGLD